MRISSDKKIHCTILIIDFLGKLVNDEEDDMIKDNGIQQYNSIPGEFLKGVTAYCHGGRRGSVRGSLCGGVGSGSGNSSKDF